MSPHKSPRSIVDQAYKAAPASSTKEEDDREFLDFMEDISVTREQLALIISMSGLPWIH